MREVFFSKIGWKLRNLLRHPNGKVDVSGYYIITPIIRFKQTYPRYYNQTTLKMCAAQKSVLFLTGLRGRTFQLIGRKTGVKADSSMQRAIERNDFHVWVIWTDQND